MKQLEVKFFASLRETLGTESLTVDWPEPADIGVLINQLDTRLGAETREILAASDILIAVNQTMVQRSHVLEPGDEVAFLPPVTGG